MALRRHESLQEFSREHHHGLLLCWKIRTGFSKNISPERIKKYVDWFYLNHLIPHFKLEEMLIFPVLEANDPLIIQALEEHQELHQLFKASNTEDALHQIQEKLEKHIRFEERSLFVKIQENASEQEFATIQEKHSEKKFEDNLTDQFWK
jgi:iron-sulfur cluster repair protein YtfE (RIC family)